MSTAFSWIHLADLQIGRPAPLHRQFLSDLRADLLDPARGPKPDALIVTGDLVHGGADDDAPAFEATAAWLRDVAQALDGPELFLVPGGRDVALLDPAARELRRLVDGARAPKDPEDYLDAAWDDARDRARLEGRLNAYRALTQQLNARGAGEAFWAFSLDPPRGPRLQVAGLNSVLLSRERGDSPEADREQLWLGGRQLELAMRGEGAQLFLILAHHPLAWLGDRERIRSWLAGRDHLWLSSHPRAVSCAEATTSSQGKTSLRLEAGVLDGAADFASYRYLRGALLLEPEGRVRARVEPRRWTQLLPGFRHDNALADGTLAFEHTFPGLRVRAPRPKSRPPGGAPTLSFWDGNTDMKRMVRLLANPAPQSTFYALEVYGPRSFGLREYLRELRERVQARLRKHLAQLGREPDDKACQPCAWVDFRFRGQTEQEVRESLGEQLRAPRGARGPILYVVTISGLDRGRRISEEARACVRLLERIAGPFESYERQGQCLVYLLCTKRRHTGRIPLARANATEDDGSVFERKVLHHGPLRLFDQDRAVAWLGAGSPVPPEFIAALARATGGHRALLGLAQDLLEDSDDPGTLPAELARQADTYFADIWKSADESAQLCLMAVAILEERRREGVSAETIARAWQHLLELFDTPLRDWREHRLVREPEQGECLAIPGFGRWLLSSSPGQSLEGPLGEFLRRSRSTQDGPTLDDFLRDLDRA